MRAYARKAAYSDIRRDRAGYCMEFGFDADKIEGRQAFGWKLLEVIVAKFEDGEGYIGDL